jgi:hypothetical protein
MKSEFFLLIFCFLLAYNIYDFINPNVKVIIRSKYPTDCEEELRKTVIYINEYFPKR